MSRVEHRDLIAAVRILQDLTRSSFIMSDVIGSIHSSIDVNQRDINK